ncbi:MAG: hypothetical protein ACKV19_09925 [Verrucomicrobiales bacterium]
MTAPQFQEIVNQHELQTRKTVDGEMVTYHIGLRELGEAEGIDWLLTHAQPNDFGTDGSLWKFPHIRDSHGSLRESSRLALADLFGLTAHVTATELADGWRHNRAKFTTRPAMLKRRDGGG